MLSVPLAAQIPLTVTLLWCVTFTVSQGTENYVSETWCAAGTFWHILTNVRDVLSRPWTCCLSFSPRNFNKYLDRHFLISKVEAEVKEIPSPLRRSVQHVGLQAKYLKFCWVLWWFFNKSRLKQWRLNSKPNPSLPWWLRVRRSCCRASPPGPPPSVPAWREQTLEVWLLFPSLPPSSLLSSLLSRPAPLP